MPGQVNPRAARSSSAAEQLVRRATALVVGGRLGDAAGLFEQAVGLHRRARHRDDEARCLALLAQCQRLAGDPRSAAASIDRAGHLARSGTPTAVAVTAEKAEVAFAMGNLDDAVLALDEAVRWQAARVGETDDGAATSGATSTAGETALASLLRRRAMVQTGRARAAEADRDFAAAAGLLAAAGDEAAARRVLVERATALHNLVADPEFPTALGEARRAVAEAGDQALTGELDMLEAAVAVGDGRLGDAEALTRSARDHALGAVEPLLYVGASAALAELADGRGDRVAAYEALVVGWATLGDLVGREAAATVFRPWMEALESRWGVEPFAVARAGYEDRRRIDLARRAGAAREP